MNASGVPFSEAVALDRSQLQPLSSTNVNQPQGSQAFKRKKLVNYLPGLPNVALDRARVSEIMQRELSTPILDELYPQLWMVGRKAANNIDSLHKQAIKGREILLSEDTQLHLLWEDDKIYIKPVASWLLNHEVWSRFLPHNLQETLRPTMTEQEKDQARRLTSLMSANRDAALGFLRSYAYLIQHESDFIVAHQHHLIPSNVSWIAWSKFIAYFSDMEDHKVCNRYHYGQMRLSRLHWAIRLFRPRSASTIWFYHLPHWSMTPYLRSILAPLAFAFATLSLVLSAMQVAVPLSAGDLRFSGLNERGLQSMRRAFWVFSISLIMASSIIWVLLLFIPFCVLAWQLQWGFRHREKSKNAQFMMTAGA